MTTFLVIALVAIGSAGILFGFDLLVNWFWQLLYYIGHWLLRLIEFCEMFCRRLCGLDNSVSSGVDTEVDTDGSILMDLIGNDTIRNAFFAILALSVILVLVFSMIQIIRLEYTTEGSKNAKGPIIKSAIKSIFYFAFIPIVSFIGIGVSNVVLQLVDTVTGSQGTIAGTVFKTSVNNETANPWRALRNGEDHPIEWSNSATFGDIVSSNGVIGFVASSLFGAGCDYYDEDTGIAYYSGTTTDSNGSNSSAGMRKVFLVDGTICGANFVGLDISSADTLDELFAQPSDNAARVDKSAAPDKKAVNLKSGEALNFTNPDAVYYFYNVSKIDYIILFMGGWFVLKTLFSTIFGLVMRLYKVVILFIISPYPVSLSVLDNGSALNKWKGQFLRELFSAYGVVVGLNLFLMILGPMSEIEFFGSAWYASFFNRICQIVIIMVGCLMINDIIGIISEYIGGGNAAKEGDAMKKQVIDTAAKMGSAAIGGVTLAAAGATTIASGVGAVASRISAKKATAISKFANKKFESRNDVQALRTQADNEGKAAAEQEAIAKQRDEEIAALDPTAANYATEKARLERQKQIATRSAAGHRRREKQAKDDIDTLKKEVGWGQIATASGKAAQLYDNVNTLNRRNMYRGGTLIKNAAVGSKLAQGFNKATFNMFTEKGKSDLDKQISASGEYGEYVMNEGAAIDKKISSSWAGRAVDGVKSFITGQRGHEERTADRAARESTENSIDAKELNVKVAKIQDMRNNLQASNSSAEFLNDLANNFDEIMKDIDITINDANEAASLKKAVEEAVMANNNRDNTDQYREHMRRAQAAANRVGNSNFINISESSIAAMKQAIKDGMSAQDFEAKFGTGMKNVMVDAMAKANQQRADKAYDKKNDNAVQELLRTMITLLSKK